MTHKGTIVPFDLSPVAEVWLAGQPIQVVRVRSHIVDSEDFGRWLVTPDNPDKKRESRWVNEADGYTVLYLPMDA